jgi:hypothetical protein
MLLVFCDVCGIGDRRFALGQHFVIEGLLRARFGEIDQDLAGVIPRLMSLESELLVLP